MTMFIQDSKSIHKRLNSGTNYTTSAFDPNVPDTRRHFILLSSIDSILRSISAKTALTIGDDRGRDAHYLKLKGLRAIASDLDTNKISMAKDDGYIDEVMQVDAESIPLESESVDYVLCKESFHHFPRPFLCLYEMLRVARMAVTVIEPFDICRLRPGDNHPTIGSYRDYYERALNYQYLVSVREFAKTAWALHLPAISVMGLNDPYTIPLDIQSWIIEKERLDEKGRSGTRQDNLKCITIFKTEPDISSLDVAVNFHKRPLSQYES